MPERLDVYTDGSASPDGRGGWAWTDGVRSGAGHDKPTTNQRMELTAAIEAIKAHDGRPVCICSDSAYMINCFVQEWHVRWVQRGWVNAAREPVANRDLWEQLIPLVLEGDVTFRKVRGHSGDVLNDLADRLAVEAKGRAV
jgi:ribonuclease HI